MNKYRRIIALAGLVLICAVVGHSINFISLDGAIFVLGVVLVAVSIAQRNQSQTAT